MNVPDFDFTDYEDELNTITVSYISRLNGEIEEEKITMSEYERTYGEPGELREKKKQEIADEVSRVEEAENWHTIHYVERRKMRKKLKDKLTKEAKIYFCEPCDYASPSEKNLITHFKSKRHQKQIGFIKGF